mgnify:CR=1 FL=1
MSGGLSEETLEALAEEARPEETADGVVERLLYTRADSSSLGSAC